ncbi:MAG: hypothetical protein MUO63_16110 [Desulfobulbaceae bacterium]|nr:hypothetical protein [Desulfobulbaceae bacterium]
MPDAKEMVCYCFSYSTEDIRQDAGIYGRSTIMERIMAASRAGICNCAASNPKGR